MASPNLILLVQIVLILGAARLLGNLMRHIGQPRVVGEMLAGLALGPSLLGQLAPTVSAAVFAQGSLSVLEAFSQVGLILYMLLVGVRMDAAHLRTRGPQVAAISLVSFAVPFLLGLALGVPLLARFAIPDASATAFVLFIGLSLSMTAFPVLVRIVQEHGLEHTRLGTTAIAVASFNDVVAWGALAVVASLHGARRPSVTGTLALVVLYAVVMVLVVGPLLRAQLNRTRSAPGRFTLVLLVALASAGVTEALGVHALFGSFLVGVLLSGDRTIGPLLAERIEPLTVTLLLPLFFATTGLRINVALVPGGGLLGLLALVVLLAVVGKVLPPALMARVGGLGWREALGLGALMNTRGLVEIVLLVVGLQSGLLPPALFTILALMAFITTAMTAPLLTVLGYPGRQEDPGTDSMPPPHPA